MDTHGNKKYKIWINIQESKHRQKRMNQHILELKNKYNLDWQRETVDKGLEWSKNMQIEAYWNR
jgi:hypothetical protein